MFTEDTKSENIQFFQDMMLPKPNLLTNFKQLIFVNNYPEYINTISFQTPGKISFGIYNNNILIVNIKEISSAIFYYLICSLNTTKNINDIQNRRIIDIAII